jgi:hypothetical protein
MSSRIDDIGDPRRCDRGPVAVDTVQDILELTERVHVLAATAEGALLTRCELERLAAQQIGVERERAADGEFTGRSRPRCGSPCAPSLFLVRRSL